MTVPILVIGHRNPDTDSIASAVGYTWLLNARNDGQMYVAGRTGKVNAQTAFALERFGVEAPMLVADVWGRVGDLAEALPGLLKGKKLLDACQTIAETQRPVPVLDEDGKPVALLTAAGLFGVLADALGSASVLALARELDRPAESVSSENGIVLESEDHIRDVVGQALRSEQDDFLVVDRTGKYIGLCRKSDLLAPPHRKLVMVDHNEPGQAVLGLEDAELVEVLDHHRLGNVPTITPIRFHVEPVGSCSTLVAEQGVEEQGVIPAAVAGLLLCGILSDTLVFRSPTTTPRDQRVAQRLAGMAGLFPANASESEVMAAITDLGKGLLAAGAGLGSQSADELLNTDLKFFESNGLSVAIAQIEVASFSELAPRLPDIREALEKLLEARKLALAMVMVTDVVLGNSRLVAVGPTRIITLLPYAHLDDDTLDAPGVVSRKKQLLPTVLAALSQAS